MTPLSWLDLGASAVSAVIAAALVLLVLGAGARRAVNVLFGLFALSGAAWAALRSVTVLSLWFNAGDPRLWQELGTLSFGAMSVFLFAFTVHYINRRSRWIDLYAMFVGLLLAASAFPPLRSHLVSRVWIDSTSGIASFELGRWGYAAGIFAALCFAICLALFWSERRRLPGRYLPISVATLLLALIFRALLSQIPITSIAAALSIGTLGYGVVNQQFLNPLRELTADLERKVSQRTQQLTETTAQLEQANTSLLRRTTQMQALLDVGRVASSILDPDKLLQQMVDLICERFGYYFAGVFVLDAEGKHVELRAGHGEAGRRLVKTGYRLAVGDQSMVGWTANHRQVRVASDASADHIRLADALLSQTRSEITLPLVAAERLLGVLDVQSSREGDFGEQDVVTLQGLADQLAIALQNARLFQETQRTLGKAEALYDASRRLTTATTISEVANAITSSVAETGADGCVVVQFEFAPDGAPVALLYLDTWRRDRAPIFRPTLRLPMSQSPFPFEMISSFWAVADVAQDERIPASARDVFERTEAKAVVNIPLQTADKVIGQVVVLRSTPGPFSETALRLYEMLSGQAAIALERATLLEKSRRQAKEEAALRAISDRVGRAMDIEAVLHSAAEELGRALQATGVYIELGPAQAAPGPKDRGQV